MTHWKEDLDREITPQQNGVWIGREDQQPPSVAQ